MSILTVRSTAHAQGSTWLWTDLQKALLLGTLAQDNLAVSLKAVASIASGGKRFADVRANAMTKGEHAKGGSKDCFEESFGGKQ